MLENHVPIVHKPTGTIQIANQFTLTERKLFNALIYHAQRNNRITADEQTIAQSEVFAAIGWGKSKNTDDLKTALRKLTGTTVEWNEFGVDRAHIWTVCTFLASGKLVRGNLKYRLNPEIVEQVRRPTLFAKMQLLVQGQFSKKYSLVLYEYLLDFISRAQEKELAIEPVPLEHLQRLLGAEAKSYSGPNGYKFFNRDVLQPAVKEINVHSDLTVEVQRKKEKRRVVAIGFLVARKESFQLAFELNAPLSAEDEKPKDDLVNRLVDLGVTRRQAGNWCRVYDRERIEGNIAQLNRLVDSGKPIRNAPGWLKGAIEDDYRPKLSKVEAERREETKKALRAQLEKAAAKAADERERALKVEWDRFRYRQMCAGFEERSDEWKNAKLKEFEENELPKLDEVTRSEYKKSGLRSVVAGQAFYRRLDEELLSEPHERSFEDYKTWKITL